MMWNCIISQMQIGIWKKRNPDYSTIENDLLVEFYVTEYK